MFHKILSYLKQIKVVIAKQDSVMFGLAMLCGVAGGISVWFLNTLSLFFHKVLFHLQGDGRLSSLESINPWYCLLIPVIGGIGLYLVRKYLGSYFSTNIVDVIEANALYGGRLSVRDSFYITIQTLFSNGFGISLGLESAYTQLASAFSSKMGNVVKTDRNKVRILVGCGAAGAIGAAFNSILGGAFYGFEIALASYGIINFPYVMLAAIMGVFMIQWLGEAGPVFHIHPFMVEWYDYWLVCVFALLCAGIGIAVMYSVTQIGLYLQQLRVGKLTRLIAGAFLVGGMGMVTPAVLGSGHGVLWMILAGGMGMRMACIILVLKSVASSVSLGVGYRGGLFFASMLLGCTAGIVYGNLLALWGIHTLPPLTYAVIGMAAVSAGIIGGPLSMMFLTLDMTSGYAMMGLVLLAVIVVTVTIRKTFGYNFATWRFHLRGEKLHSALDISDFKKSIAQTLMKPIDFLLKNDVSVQEAFGFLQKNQKDYIVLCDEGGDYAGLVRLTDFYGKMDRSSRSVETLAIRKNRVLTPGMNIKEILDSFNDVFDCSWMVVVRGIDNYQMLGILNKGDVLNRYNDILERQVNELSGTRLY